VVRQDISLVIAPTHLLKVLGVAVEAAAAVTRPVGDRRNATR
jgi:hypothetical protein